MTGRPRKASSTLKRARELLVNEGWCQKSECRVVPHIGTRYCARGAVAAALGLLEFHRGGWRLDFRRVNASTTYDLALDFLTQATPVMEDFFGEDSFQPDIVEYNDYIDTDLAKVLRVYDDAIALALASEERKTAK